MSTPAPGTCELCKHWDYAARKRMQRFRIQHPDLPNEAYENQPCTGVRFDGIEVVVGGRDGFVESIDTDNNFGCNRFAPLEDE